MSFETLPTDTDPKALRAFLDRIEHSLEMVNRRLRRFEEEFGMDSEVFYAKLQNAELEERVEYAEWAGEHEMQKRLLRQRDELRQRLK
jgi:hypothetical protein